MLLEPRVVEAIDALTPERDDMNAVPRWRLMPLMIYLADTITDGKVEVPYSIIASDDRRVFTKEGKVSYVLADDQILLMSWPGSPLRAKPGTVLTVSYYVPDEKNQLQIKAEKFNVQSVEQIEGVLDDPDLVPEVPGVTDKLDITNWVSPPFPYNPTRNKQADIDYSKRYRTTPRAYINLKRAQALWKNRFGALTSIQVRDGGESAEALPEALLKALRPEQGGFVFQPVRDSAVAASAGTTDFGEYFLYFSFFLIVSALLMVGLLVRLNLDHRAGELGLLLAIGWAPSRVVLLLLGEGAALAVVGSAVGLGGALIYARLMLRMLSANWPGGADLAFLHPHAEPTSLFIGFSSSLAVSVLTLWWATRALGQLSPRSLLSGETTQSAGPVESELGWSRWLVPIGVVGAVGLAITARFMPSTEAQAGCFFGGGALLLTACLAGAWNGLKLLGKASSPQPTLTGLGIRNAGRHLVRSVLTVGLLGAASFLIVAVESFHMDTDKNFHKKTGGSGGFALLAEGNVPVFEDLNDPKVRNAHRLDTPALVRVNIYPCRAQPGDDASCLNLYKPLKPRVVSFSKELIERGGFDFAASLAQSAQEKANPWLLLQQPADDAIPAIIDANTAEWTLKTPLGGIVEVNDAEGKPRKLRIVGLLSGSIFQSEIVVAEKAFLSLYPQQAGFSFLLIDTADADSAKLKTIEQDLSKGLEAFNIDVQTTAERLRGYLAVRNMYLATFQALGGLGLVPGAVGLAIVLLRGVWERRAELALLQALGFRSGQLAWLVLAENVFLLVCGLAAGTASALLAVAPYLTGAGAANLWSRIGVMLALVSATGLVSAVLAVWSTLRTPVLTALRRE
ncbi:MAG: FtsX-like permease family protein [Planctomycetes bacterium]|nr:FtsX-like permease family protein [Planctomycetota bacterium]